MESSINYLMHSMYEIKKKIKKYICKVVNLEKELSELKNRNLELENKISLLLENIDFS